jgi:hypothetical protein
MNVQAGCTGSNIVNRRWEHFAYHARESGQFEVFVRPYPGADRGRQQISTGGGQAPWSPGPELVLSIDGELRRSRLYRPGQGYALSRSIFAVRAALQPKGWAA